jgi:CheY-like chemotaxis protein
MQRRKAILCLCHDAIMLQVRQMLLEHFGYEVWATESVEDAAAIAVDSCPDMLLMDNSYPGVNLEQVAERIKKDCPGMLAVVLSPLFGGRRPTPAAVDYFLAQNDGPDALRANLEELFGAQGDGDTATKAVM